MADIIVEGWGKKCKRPCSFVKRSSFGVNFTNFDEVLSLNQLFNSSPIKWTFMSLSFNLSVEFVAIYTLLMG